MQVIPDRPRGEIEALSDLFVTEARGSQFSSLPFLWCQCAPARVITVHHLTRRSQLVASSASPGLGADSLEELKRRLEMGTCEQC